MSWAEPTRQECSLLAATFGCWYHHGFCGCEFRDEWDELVSDPAGWAAASIDLLARWLAFTARWELSTGDLFERVLLCTQENSQDGAELAIAAIAAVT